VLNSQSPRLALSSKLGWATGQVAIAAHMAIISIYLLFYLTDVQHLPGSLAGTLILVPRLWNIFTDPIVGGISDRVRSRWGRRRPFLLAGSTLWGLAFALMFWIPTGLTLTGKSVWFLVAYLIVNTGLSLYHVPYSAMAAEMTRDPIERTSLIAVKEVTARASVLAAVLLSPIVIALAPQAALGYRILGLVIGVVVIVSGWSTFVMTRNAPAIAYQEQNLSWRQQIDTFRSNRPLFVLSAAYTLTSATDAFYSALFIYFVTICLGQDSAATGVLYPIGSLASIALTPVWGLLGARVGKVRACAIAFLTVAGIFLLAPLVPIAGTWSTYPFMILLGGSLAGMFLLPNAIIPDTVEYDEALSGMRREGTIYGAWVFTQQTGMALGTFFVGVFLDLIGQTSGAPGAHQSLAITTGFALIPATLVILATVLLRAFSLDRRGAVSGVAGVRPPVADMLSPSDS